MDSTYKQGLIRKLDGLTALERSGYGIPREKAEAPFTLKEYVLETGRAAATLLAFLLCALAVALLTI